MSISIRSLLSAALFASTYAIPGRRQASTLTADNHPASTQEATVPTPSQQSLGGSNAHAYHSPAWVPHSEDLTPRLSQHETNGNSDLGTSQAPHMPPYIGGGPMPRGYPWGGRTAKHTNPYTDAPNTGVTRYYSFTITEQTIAPDGVPRQGLVINGAFPGPTITANWGDMIEVTVQNDLPNEGTSLHWHGLLQTQTPWMDGVPAVQQCPIPPGSSFTYRFQADLYGTSWYHSHYSAQYAGGLFGPMIIYGPSDNAQYDVDLGPILINDWYHEPYYTLIEQVMAPIATNTGPPLSNNVLINGKMNYPCSNSTPSCTPNAGVSKFYFESGKKYRLRLINAGAEGMQKFSIDGYQLTVIANDFVPIEPYTTDVVTLGVGQRTDVVVEASGQPTDAVWMRSTLGPNYPDGCALPDGVSPTAMAAIYYQNANTSAVPTTESSVPTSAITTCQNDPLTATVPYCPIAPPAQPDVTQNLDVTFQSNGTNYLFYVNNSTYRGDYNDPILLEAKLGHDTFSSESNVYNFGHSRSVRFVLYNYAPTGAHPIHLHGHNMYVLAEGSGTWDGTVVNPANPQRRDTQLLANAVSASEPSYLVLQIDSTNPGVWPLHCHIAWHVSAGLYINILEHPHMIERHMPIPSTSAQNCRAWATWTGTNIPDEIDSGL